MESPYQSLILIRSSYIQVLSGPTTNTNMMPTRVVNTPFACHSLILCSLKASHRSRPRLSLPVTSIEIEKRRRREKRSILQIKRQKLRMRLAWSKVISHLLDVVLTKSTKRYWILSSFRITKESKKRCMRPTRLDFHPISSGYLFFKSLS